MIIGRPISPCALLIHPDQEITIVNALGMFVEENETLAGAWDDQVRHLCGDCIDAIERAGIFREIDVASYFWCYSDNILKPAGFVISFHQLFNRVFIAFK